MSKATFLNNNLILNSNLSLISGNTDAQFPLDNIKHSFTTKIFRSTVPSVEILIDLKTMEEVDIIALKGSCIDGIGFLTASIEGSPTKVFNGTPVSIDISSLHNFAFKELSSSSHRYWKLTLTGTDYVEVSNIFIGKKVQLANNGLNIGFSYGVNTNARITKNSYNQRFIDTFNYISTLSGEIKLLNSEEFSILNNLNTSVEPIWFLLDPEGTMDIENSNFLFSGYFYLKDLDYKNIAPGLYDVSISLEEAT